MHLTCPFTSKPPVSISSGTSSRLTNRQLALAGYYSLLSLGVKPGDQIDLSEAARHLHLLSDKPYRSLCTSELYKHLRASPDWSNPRSLHRDLRAIRPVFHALGIKRGLQAIDAALSQLSSS